MMAWKGLAGAKWERTGRCVAVQLEGKARNAGGFLDVASRLWALREEFEQGQDWVLDLRGVGEIPFPLRCVLEGLTMEARDAGVSLDVLESRAEKAGKESTQGETKMMQNGMTREMEQTLADYTETAYSVALRLTGDDNKAEGLVHKAMGMILREGLPAGSKGIKPYLLSLIRNLFINQYTCDKWSTAGGSSTLEGIGVPGMRMRFAFPKESVRMSCRSS